MLNGLYAELYARTPAAPVIIAVAMMLFCGFLATRVTKKLRLPNVTAYILTGVILGPFCLDLIPDQIVVGSEFLSDIALAFIAFSAGQYFRLETLRRNGVKVLVITLLEALLASVLVFLLCYGLLRLNLPFSIVLAALASTTAPASTMLTIRQTGAKGNFVDTLLQVVALDDVVGLVAYGTAVSMAMASLSGSAFSLGQVVLPILKNLGVLALGGVFGLLLKLLVSPKTRTTDNRLIIAVSLLFAFCGICTALEISPLLGCMSMSTVYVNVTGDDRLFKQLNYFSPPLLLLFFVRSGLCFDLNALIRPSGSVGAVPLIVVGICYFLVRILGKYLGAFLGCQLVGSPKKTRNFLGLALIPQAGVAIGLAALGRRALGGETGAALETIVLAASVLYELIGPASAKLSLYLSGSYSNKLEELVELPELTPDGKPKTQLELLIERIEKIQEELPRHGVSEEERAFTEAAEAYHSQERGPFV